MSSSEKDTFSTRDGKKLYTRSWKPSRGAAVAALIFVHGFSDHINAYYDLFPFLSSPAHNIAVYGFDQRGWGRSVKEPKDAGVTGPTSQVLSDIHDFVQHVAKLLENTGKPLFLMGHSMGGNEVLYYMLSTSSALSDRPAIAGVLLEAPFVEVDPSARPSWFGYIALQLTAALFPHKQVKRIMNPAPMSRSAKVRQEWAGDALCHDTSTMEGMRDLLQRGAELSSLSHGQNVQGLTNRLPCPLWCGHGSMDKVTSPDAARRMVDELEVLNDDKEYKLYEGAYHKLHAEPHGDGEQFAKDVAGWIENHVHKPLNS